MNQVEPLTIYRKKEINDTGLPRSRFLNQKTTLQEFKELITGKEKGDDPVKEYVMDTVLDHGPAEDDENSLRVPWTRYPRAETTWEPVSSLPRS